MENIIEVHKDQISLVARFSMNTMLYSVQDFTLYMLLTCTEVLEFTSECYKYLSVVMSSMNMVCSQCNPEFYHKLQEVMQNVNLNIRSNQH